jgi:site-specific DNA-methyltransferase (adenine-specific)
MINETDIIFNDDFFNIENYDLPKVKMVLTSPPYFDARNYNNEKLFTEPKEWTRWCYTALIILKNILQDGGVIWWNTGSGYKNYKKMLEVYRLVALSDVGGYYLIDEIPWIKKSAPPKNVKNRPYPAWEHNYIFSPTPDKVEFYRDNVRRPYAPATLSRMKYKLGKLSADLNGEYGDPQQKFVTPNPKGATPPNYLIIPQDYSKRPHPAPMSPELANWAIRAYTQEGDIVLDPMMGIGTTWIECKKLNRKFIGFELYQEYIDIANLSVERFNRGEDPYNGLINEWRKNNEEIKTID